MAQIIKIKRRIGTAGAPTLAQLTVGEIAYNRETAAHATNPGPDNLYVSDGVGVHPLVSPARQLELTGPGQTVNKVVTFGSFPVFPAGTANQVLHTTDAAGTLAWTAAVSVPPALVLKGEFNASTGTTGAVENAVAPLTNAPLPAAAAANEGFFVIVNTEGTVTTGNAPHEHMAVGDWVVSTTGGWIHINLHFAIVAASNVAVNPAVATQTDVQAALEWLYGRGPLVGATDPATGMQAGDLFYNTSAPAQLKIYNGTAWVSVTPPAAAATVVADGVSIQGDGAATGTYPATGPLQVLTVDGGQYL